MTLRHYIVCARDTSLCLIGPFESVDAATDWACKPGTYGEVSAATAVNNPTDDSRWQTIQLNDADIDWAECYPVIVMPPDDGPMPP